jgi:4-aminobutyrate aminotransferase-like enzyme
MRDQGVLVGAAGRFGNILKIRPPLCFGRTHVDILVAALEQSLAT